MPHLKVSTTGSWFAMAALVSAFGCAPLDDHEAELDAEAEDAQVEDGAQEDKKRLSSYVCTEDGSRGGRHHVTFTARPKVPGGLTWCDFSVYSNRLYKSWDRMDLREKRDITTNGTALFLRGRKACIHYEASCMTVESVRFGVE